MLKLNHIFYSFELEKVDFFKSIFDEYPSSKYPFISSLTVDDPSHAMTEKRNGYYQPIK